MNIERDFDLEQETGVCSNCGRQLQPLESEDGSSMHFDTCPDCDDVDESPDIGMDGELLNAAAPDLADPDEPIDPVWSES
jgi:hypothetical protein